MMKKISGMVFAFMVLMLLGSCSEQESRTTDTLSSAFSTKSEKMEFLEQYYTAATEILDTEYHIIYQDNDTGLVPGPSDWSFKVAFKIEKSQVDEWITEEMEKSSADQVDITWWDELLIGDIDWKSIPEKPECYRIPDADIYLVVYREAGIVLKYLYVM